MRELRIKAGYNLRKSPGVNIVVRGMDGGPDEAAIFSLNESGALLWDTLKNGAGKEELLAAIQNEYSVEAGRAMGDIEEFLDMLREKNVLEE